MFQFRRFPSYAYLIQRRMLEYCSSGFPHSEISGSKLMCSSPKLIAACHVLHRLLMPRHSPCALSSLTLQNSLRCSQNLQELCRPQSSFGFHCFTHSLERLSPFYLKVPQHLLLPSVACFALLSIYIVQFSRCSSSLFRDQIETSVLRCFDPTSKEVVGPSGLEPPTSRLSVVRSSQLSYGPVSVHSLVEIIGLEPMTLCLQSRCSPS